MDKDNIFYMWDDKYLPWLRRRHKAGECVTREDLGRILTAEPEAANDPLMLEYLVRLAKGELRGKVGRKARERNRWWLYYGLDALIQERAEEIREEIRDGRRGPRLLSDVSPSAEAAEEYARLLRMGSGRSLTNAISRWRRSQKLAA